MFSSPLFTAAGVPPTPRPLLPCTFLLSQQVLDTFTVCLSSSNLFSEIIDQSSGTKENTRAAAHAECRVSSPKPYFFSERFPPYVTSSAFSLILIASPSERGIHRRQHVHAVCVYDSFLSSTLQFMYQESPRTSDLEMHFLKEYNSFRDTCRISVSVRIRFGCGCWETKTDLEERFLSPCNVGASPNFRKCGGRP